MRAYRNLFLALSLSLTLPFVSAFGDTDRSETSTDKSPLLNLRQFPLPPVGIGYHSHNCYNETQWMLCKVYEIQADGSLNPYCGQLDWDAYDVNGREIWRSCCSHEGYVKIDKRFMNPGDVYFIAAIKDGEVLFGMPHADAEPNVPHFSAIPIWTYNDFAQWYFPYYEFCLDCNKLQAGNFSELSTARGGPRLHSSLTIYIPAKSSVIVTKSAAKVNDVPVYYITSNNELSAYQKALKRTDENGVVGFHIHREEGDIGFYALHGGCLHPSKKRLGYENVFEIELPDNMVTLVLKNGEDVLHGRRVLITDAELNATISASELITDEAGQIQFIPPSKSQYRILVFDRLQPYVSLQIQAPTIAETIIFDIAGKKEEGNSEAASIVDSTPSKENAKQTNPRLVFPELRQSWEDFQFTSVFGRVEDRSRVREFNIHEVLQKSRTPIDNRRTLAEILFFERVLYSLLYTELSWYAAREKQNVQQPTLAPSVPSP